MKQKWVELQARRIPSIGEPPEIVWVTPEDLEKCELNRVFSSRRLISRAGLEKNSAKLFPRKTVLLSTTATIGKVGIAEKPLSANQQISGIVCRENFNPEFLAYYLLGLWETLLKKLGGTATATHINQANLVIRKRFHIADIRDARAVRNRWYYGWGIRYTPHGWMFNVSGLDAVELELSNNTKFRIGTDEPHQLVAAIQQARQLAQQ